MKLYSIIFPMLTNYFALPEMANIVLYIEK